MSDVTDLLAAVADVRSGSGLSRARSSVTAMQTLMRMSPEDKRAVAVMVAERAAPHLVERIEAGTGQDLSKEQVETVLQLFQKLDADDLDELRATVTDAERRGAALRDVTSAAATSAAVASGLDELVPPRAEESIETDHEDDADVDAEMPGDDAIAPAAAVDHAPVDHDAPEPEGAPDDDAELEAARAQVDAELAELEAEAERMKAEARRAQAAAEAEIEAMGSGEDDATASRAGTRRLPERALDDPLFDDLPDVALPAELEEEPSHGDLRETAPSVRPTRARVHPPVDTLRDALATAGSGSAALGLLRAALDEIADRDDAELLDLVRLVPDGWARRRAVEALVAADQLHGEDAADAVRILRGAGDRRFVAGTLLDAGHATAAQLRGTVDDRTLDRMARRTG